MFKHLAAAAVAAIIAAPAQATFIPSGVQFDTPISTVTGAWGWTEIYREDYGGAGPNKGFDNPEPFDDVFAGAGDWIMLGAIDGDAQTIALLAAIRTDIYLTTRTDEDAAYESNGAQWYNNALSTGFLGLGDALEQFTADVNVPNSEFRLSWHTAGGDGSICTGSETAAALPTSLCGGYRAGAVLGLNTSTQWDRVVYTLSRSGSAEIPLPLPAALLLTGLGALVVGARRRKA